MTKRRWMALGLLVFASACVLPEPPPPLPRAQLPPATVAAPAPPAVAVPLIVPAPLPAATPPVPPAAPVALAPPPRTLNPADLHGKQRDEVTALLGRPDLARPEPGAEVLLYQGQGCTLFVYLYAPAGGGQRRVEYVELGPGTRDVSRDTSCLTGLLMRVAGS